MVSHTVALYSRDKSVGLRRRSERQAEEVIGICCFETPASHDITRKMKNGGYKGKCNWERIDSVSVSHCNLHGLRGRADGEIWNGGLQHLTVSSLERNSTGGTTNVTEKNKNLAKKCLSLAKPCRRHTQITSFFVTWHLHQWHDTCIMALDERQRTKQFLFTDRLNGSLLFFHSVFEV